MTGHLSLRALICTGAVALLVGCRPQQPFYFFERTDLSHYKAVATDIEYPEVQNPSLAEVAGATRPLSLENKDVKAVWELRLQEAVQIALANSKVMKSIGGQILGPPSYLTQYLPDQAPTIYGPAMVESDPRTGVEAALSAFDAQMAATTRWDKIDQPRNQVSFLPAFPSVVQDDTGTFQAQIKKTNATGGTTSLTHSWVYDANNTPVSVGGNRFKFYPSNWTVVLRGEVRQPLLQGGGVQFNRIAGPGATPGNYNGVMLARINDDVALCTFEQSVRNLVSDVEVAYWELYYTYRQLDAVIAGRDSAQESWRQADEGWRKGKFSKLEEAQARNQYFLFRDNMERSLNALYQAESKLRYLMGIATSDGRLIRPADEPTTAKVVFDWCSIHTEAMVRSVDIRLFRWTVKRRELELIAARNFLLPRLDFVGAYQWQGLGDQLIESSGGTGDFTQPGSNAYQSLTSGAYANWTMGMEFSMPIGFRRELAGVRNAQLAVARDRAKLQEVELEVSHQLAYALRELEALQVVAQTDFNRRIAARDEVTVAQAKLEAGVGLMRDVLDAQRRQAEADSAYYRTLADYNKSIAQVHFRKGSLLEYDGVYLAEGPWPAKAYFDAERRARERDASIPINYGFTYPRVISRGPVAQTSDQPGAQSGLARQQPGNPAGATPTEALPAPPPSRALPPAPVKPLPAKPAATTAHADVVAAATPTQPPRVMTTLWPATETASTAVAATTPVRLPAIGAGAKAVESPANDGGQGVVPTSACDTGTRPGTVAGAWLIGDPQPPAGGGASPAASAGTANPSLDGGPAMLPNAALAAADVRATSSPSGWSPASTVIVLLLTTLVMLGAFLMSSLNARRARGSATHRQPARATSD